MNIHDLRQAQANYQGIPDIRKELYKLREQFVKHFTPKRLASLPLEHYAIGNELPNSGLIFCYTLEQKLAGLGKMVGSTALKFGVYYGRTKSDPKIKYRFAKKYGNDYFSVYDKIKLSILDLLKNGKEENINAISDNILSPMFKGKILSTYYPERFLNIFSNDHLDHFLIQLNLDNEKIISSDEVYKREALLKFKNSDEIMKDWTVDMFAYFLYEYIGPPVKEGNFPKILNEFIIPEFPPNPEPSPVNLKMLPQSSKAEINDNASFEGQNNPDYELIQKKLKKYGDRGEKIVFDYEVEKLTRSNKVEFAKNVEKIKIDSKGFDILSFDIDGKPRQIEVKATNANPGSANFFLSSNEFKKAQHLENYFIYIVFNVLSAKPKVWEIPNPFNPKNECVSMVAQTYRVQINASLL